MKRRSLLSGPLLALLVLSVGFVNAQRTFRVYLNPSGYKGNITYSHGENDVRHYFINDPQAEVPLDFEIKTDELYQLDTGNIISPSAIMFNRDNTGKVGNVYPKEAGTLSRTMVDNKSFPLITFNTMQNTFRLYLHLNNYKGSIDFKGENRIDRYNYITNPRGEVIVDLDIRSDGLYEVDTGEIPASGFYFNRDNNGFVSNVFPRDVATTSVIKVEGKNFTLLTLDPLKLKSNKPGGKNAQGAPPLTENEILARQIAITDSIKKITLAAKRDSILASTLSRAERRMIPDTTPVVVAQKDNRGTAGPISAADVSNSKNKQNNDLASVLAPAKVSPRDTVVMAPKPATAVANNPPPASQQNLGENHVSHWRDSVLALTIAQAEKHVYRDTSSPPQKDSKADASQKAKTEITAANNAPSNPAVTPPAVSKPPAAAPSDQGASYPTRDSILAATIAKAEKRLVRDTVVAPVQKENKTIVTEVPAPKPKTEAATNNLPSFQKPSTDTFAVPPKASNVNANSSTVVTKAETVDKTIPLKRDTVVVPPAAITKADTHNNEPPAYKETKPLQARPEIGAAQVKTDTVRNNAQIPLQTHRQDTAASPQALNKGNSDLQQAAPPIKQNANKNNGVNRDSIIAIAMANNQKRVADSIAAAKRKESKTHAENKVEISKDIKKTDSVQRIPAAQAHQDTAAKPEVPNIDNRTVAAIKDEMPKRSALDNEDSSLSAQIRALERLADSVASQPKTKNTVKDAKIEGGGVTSSDVLNKKSETKSASIMPVLKQDTITMALTKPTVKPLADSSKPKIIVAKVDTVQKAIGPKKAETAVVVSKKDSVPAPIKEVSKTREDPVLAINKAKDVAPGPAVNLIAPPSANIETPASTVDNDPSVIEVKQWLMKNNLQYHPFSAEFTFMAAHSVSKAKADVDFNLSGSALVWRYTALNEKLMTDYSNKKMTAEDWKSNAWETTVKKKEVATYNFFSEYLKKAFGTKIFHTNFFTTPQPKRYHSE